MDNPKDDKGTQVVDVQPLTPHDRALYEAGKTMLVESVETGRKFCETMIGVATGAVAVFVALLGIVTPKDHVLTVVEGTRGIIAGVLFLLAALCFVFGYLPRKSKLSLDLPGDIEKARASIIAWRHTWGWVGFGLFVVGVALAAYAAFCMIGAQAPESGTDMLLRPPI